MCGIRSVEVLIVVRGMADDGIFCSSVGAASASSGSVGEE